MLDNYPPGAANDPNAPYNQSEPDEMEIEVTVSITLSKTVKISVTDYEYFEGERDEDGCSIPPSYDFSNCDLEAAVKKQIYLPNEAGDIIEKGYDANEITCAKYADIAEDLKDWIIDDMEVILEE